MSRQGSGACYRGLPGRLCRGTTSFGFCRGSPTIAAWAVSLLGVFVEAQQGVHPKSCADAALDDETGLTWSSFLGSCGPSANAAARMAVAATSEGLSRAAGVPRGHMSIVETGGSTHSEPLSPSFFEELNSCQGLAEQFVNSAFASDSPMCESCPEVCGLVLFFAAIGNLGGSNDFGGTATCSQTLLMLVKSFRHLDSGVALEWIGGVYGALPLLVETRREECAAERQKELQHVKLPQPRVQNMDVSPNFDESLFDGGVAEIVEKTSDSSNRPAIVSTMASSFQVAILVAATPSMIRTYQPFLNIWRCYALRHDLVFILETDDTEVSWPHTRSPNWIRWFAARKHIEFYKALLVVDPDQFVVPECWNMSIPAILGAWADGPDGQRPAPDVATRDFGRPQTLNNGVVLVRSSNRGKFFLDLLLEKAAWMQTIERDQGAFDESVLEMLGFEAQLHGERGYDSSCAAYVFPNARGNHEIGRYALCWWQASEELAGPFGARRSAILRFVDPRNVDVNHVVGARGLSEPALLHHFAGRSKDWDAMLETFGMSRRATSDCGQVHRHVDGVALQRACTPGGPVVTACEPPMVVC